jgi:hypothetical protein
MLIGPHERRSNEGRKGPGRILNLEIAIWDSAVNDRVAVVLIRPSGEEGVVIEAATHLAHRT